MSEKLPTFAEAMAMDTWEGVRYADEHTIWGMVRPNALKAQAKVVNDRAVELFRASSLFATIGPKARPLTKREKLDRLRKAK